MFLCNDIWNESGNIHTNHPSYSCGLSACELGQKNLCIPVCLSATKVSNRQTVTNLRCPSRNAWRVQREASPSQLANTKKVVGGDLRPLGWFMWLERQSSVQRAERLRSNICLSVCRTSVCLFVCLSQTYVAPCLKQVLFKRCPKVKSRWW